MSVSSSTKTVNTWLARASKILKNAGIGSAYLDTLILLEDETGHDRAWLLAHSETLLQGRALQRLERQIARRTKHEPLAYIRSRTQFYDREFYISKQVLEPRPESETMITLLKDLLYHKPLVYRVPPCRVARAGSCKVIDLGTGSGALAITTKLEMPKIEVTATDIDPKCLKVARQNAHKYSVKIKFLRGDLLLPLKPWTLDSGLWTILANLPYVPDNFHINQAAAMEPRLAIFGGRDGLNVYHRLFIQLQPLKTQPRFILTESMPPQHKKLAQIARSSGFKLKTTEDFIQLFEKT